MLSDGTLSGSSEMVNINSSDAPLFVAKYIYLARTKNDLSLRKGQLLYILNTDDKDWWWARSTSSEEGYIPSNHVATYGSLDAEK